MHFDESQFEAGRTDRKLKATAVPTKFSHSNPPRHSAPRRQLKRIMPPVEKSTDKPKLKKVKMIMQMNDHTYTNNKDNIQKQSMGSRSDHSYSTITLNPETSTAGTKTAAAATSTTTMESDAKCVINGSCISRSYDVKTDLIIRLRQQVRSLQRQNAVLHTKLDGVTKKLQKFLHTDQIQQLQGSRYGKWTSETIRTAIKIQTVTGKNGYEYLRTEIGYPLPSYRTLCERVETLKMVPGVQTDVMELLKIMTQDMAPRERDCVLILDEVQLR